MAKYDRLRRLIDEAVAVLREVADEARVQDLPVVVRELEGAAREIGLLVRREIRDAEEGGNA